jgi:sRNA-binding regulator protein Hfq
VARQPDKRPHSDPRPFLAHVGQPVRLVLRNGITLELPLMKVGSFDLLLGEEGHELFVPLHAILRFESTAPANEADAAEDEA